MIPHKPVKIKHPSPIRLTHSSRRKRAFGLIFWISDYRRTADVVVMLYAVLSFEILYQGGGIGLCIWITIVIVAGRRIYKYRNTNESKIIATAFLGWCVATLVEPFTSCFLMGMFVVAYHSNSMLLEKKNKMENNDLKKWGRVHIVWKEQRYECK